ncbi:DUF309 domain-containing protein [Vallicoccus soli]|uniref:DUF309 domain-containing protein n=1 Tax=Vallicoccus soli TaxID=2339232 RepID=UPI001C49B80F|nr:DUF309 domain-containing protein [Vallicoccus soli]
MDAPPDRDRDEQGRARNARPRDGLGRPLPHGAPGVERVPDDLVLPPAESLVEAQRRLDLGEPFQAHEVLEGTWKAAPEPERELWRGLAQVAVGLTHLARGNSAGAVALLERGGARVGAYAADPPHGVDAAGLAAFARGLAARVAADPATPVPPPPRLRG